jgi:asparagine synthase (glutamine-hydrolysing)
MLGGYTFYLAARFISLIKQCRFKEAWQLLKSSRQNGNHILFRSLSYLLPFSWQMPLRKFSGQAFVPSWLNESWFLERGVELTPLKTKYGKHVLQDELLHTFSVTSLPMLLRYEDRNSMAYSIESRVPFLTTQLVEFIFSLPENYIISAQGLSKAIFRKAMHGIVPQSILARRDKIGFATPEKNWLFKMRPWMEETLCSEYVKNLPIFNHKTLLSNWQYMLRGKGIFDCRYWRWINFIKWAQLHQVDFSDG